MLPVVCAGYVLQSWLIPSSQAPAFALARRGLAVLALAPGMLAGASKAAAKTSNPTERARVAANIAVPYHYFDAEQPRQGAHDFDGAWLLMKALNASQSAPLALVAPDATGHSAVFNAEVVA